MELETHVFTTLSQIMITYPAQQGIENGTLSKTRMAYRGNNNVLIRANGDLSRQRSFTKVHPWCLLSYPWAQIWSSSVVSVAASCSFPKCPREEKNNPTDSQTSTYSFTFFIHVFYVIPHFRNKVRAEQTRNKGVLKTYCNVKELFPFFVCFINLEYNF